MSLSKSVNLAHAQTVVPCNVCDDETPGQYYCKECKQTLCPQCEKYHRRSAASKDHNVVLRTEIADVDTTVLSCIDHGEQASFHCEKCNVSVCAKCITGKHKGHALSDLTTIFDKEKKLLQTDITRMLTENLPYLKKRREDIITSKEKYEKKIEQITKEMEDENQALHRELDKRHEERIQNLASIRDFQLATFNAYSKEIRTKIDLYEERLSEYQDAIGKNHLPALLKVAKGKQSLPEIGSESVLHVPEPPTFVPGNIHTIVENLGKLYVSSPSSVVKPLKLTTPTTTVVPEPPTFVPGNIHTIVENLGKLFVFSPSSVVKPLKLTTPTVVSKFKCPLQGYPSICITKEGDVWLGGNESRDTVHVSFKGQVLRRRRVQNRVNALAVMDCGDLIISPHREDSRSVSRLLINDKENIVFDASPSCSTGVSVTADQKILICTGDGRVVRTNGDGTNVKQIYKGSGSGSAIHAVENADGNIYISDCTMPVVVMVSRVGNVLSTITHTIGGQRLGLPYGLVLDKMGNILCADISKNCEYIIDQNQQMRELVGLSRHIQFPRWLAVDGENNLWITQEDGNVLVLKCFSP